MTEKMEIIHYSKIIPATKTVVDFNEVKPKLDILQKMCLEQDGLGLTSTQIGFDEKMFVMVRDGNLVNILNPAYVPMKDDGFIKSREGCLSVPSSSFLIRRWKTIDAKWQDEYGEVHKEILSEEDAIVFQHEFDHLSAKSIVDRFNGQYRSKRWEPKKKHKIIRSKS